MPLIALTDMDRWWLQCWEILERHDGRPPTVRRLAAYTDRSLSSAHRALERLELAGILRRGEDGRFVRRSSGAVA